MGRYFLCVKTVKVGGNFQENTSDIGTPTIMDARHLADLVMNDRRKYKLPKYPSRQSQNLYLAHRAFLLALFFRAPAAENSVTNGQPQATMLTASHSVITCAAFLYRLSESHRRFSVRRKAQNLALSQVTYSLDTTTLRLTLDCVLGHSMRVSRSEDQQNGGNQGEVLNTVVLDEEVEASHMKIPSLGTWRTLKSTKRFESIIHDTPE